MVGVIIMIENSCWSTIIAIAKIKPNVNPKEVIIIPWVKNILRIVL